MEWKRAAAQVKRVVGKRAMMKMKKRRRVVVIAGGGGREESERVRVRAMEVER